MPRLLICLLQLLFWRRISEFWGQSKIGSKEGERKIEREREREETCLHVCKQRALFSTGFKMPQQWACSPGWGLLFPQSWLMPSSKWLAGNVGPHLLHYPGTFFVYLYEDMRWDTIPDFSRSKNALIMLLKQELWTRMSHNQSKSSPVCVKMSS